MIQTNTIIQNAFLILFVFIAIGLILTIGRPMIDKAESVQTFKEAERFMGLMDNYIRETASEHEASRRDVSLSIADGDINVRKSTDSIEYSLETNTEFLQYLTRRKQGDLLYIVGNDVICNDTGSKLIMENTHLRVELNKINCSTPSCLDTKYNILNMTQKDTDITIAPADTSVYIDGNTSTAVGTGYSELLINDTEQPLCITHFSVNSGVDYEIYYKLYAGADFLDIDVRNIR